MKGVTQNDRLLPKPVLVELRQLDLGFWRGGLSIMDRRTRIYIGSVVTVAGVLLWLLFTLDPVVSRPALIQISLLGLMALVAEGMGYVLTKSVSATVALVPYIAMVLVTGNWLAPATVLVIK